MIAMFLTLVLLIAPATLLMLVSILRRRRYIDNHWSLWFIALIAVVAPAGALPAWQVHPVYGIAYALATYSGVVLFSLSLTDVYVVQVWMLFPAAVAVITLLPVIVLPLFSTSRATMISSTGQALDVSFVGKSTKHMEDSIASAIRDIEHEQANIKEAASTLSREIELKNQLIRQLENERSALLTQIQQQQALAALTKDQAEAVRDSLSRGKYVDYFIGFVIGVISSIVASVAIRFMTPSAKHANG